MTAMTSLGQTAVPDAAAPRLDDDMANLRELARALAEAPVSQVTDAGADRPREGGRNGRNGCRERGPDAYVGRCVLSTGFEQKSHLDLSSSVTDLGMRNRAGQACCMSAWRTRYDSPLNCRRRPWCTTRSMTAAAIWSSPKTWPQRENSRFVVITTDCLS